MVRSELIERLRNIQELVAGSPASHQIDLLLIDIDEDGVLDVQAPPEVAASMGLPRPAQ